VCNYEVNLSSPLGILAEARPECGRHVVRHTPLHKHTASGSQQSRRRSSANLEKQISDQSAN